MGEPLLRVENLRTWFASEAGPIRENGRPSGQDPFSCRVLWQSVDFRELLRRR